MNQVHNLVHCFRDMLVRCWSTIAKVASDSSADNLLNDWCQSSWEMVVEAALSAKQPIFLEVYGEGADCNGESSRVLYPDKKPSHRIEIKTTKDTVDVINGQKVKAGHQVWFDRFVTKSEGWYREEPPFDHVLVLVNESEAVIPLDEVVFVLVEVEK